MARTTLDLDGLQRLLWGFASHRVVTVAGRVGILRMLADGPLSSDEIARTLGLDSLATGKIVRALAALGVAEASEDGYTAAAALRPHFTPGDADVVPFLEHSHSMYDRWGETLEPWLRGEAWPVAQRTPEEIHRFGAAMQAMGAQQAKRVAGLLDLGGTRRLLDVGGGWGHFSIALCRVQPQLTATVLDTPTVVEKARATPAAAAMGDRLDFVAGDYLEADFGSGYDRVLFANVLHQENADRAAEMVRRGATALAPGGRVVVVDFAIDDARCEHVLGTLFAINMRSFGDTWTELEIRGWMDQAGLEDVRRTDVGPDRWIIEGSKPR
jgi:tRNA A58 N-methylase Trm61